MNNPQSDQPLDVPDELAPQTESSGTGVPPFGIKHIMLLTAFAAAQFAGGGIAQSFAADPQTVVWQIWGFMFALSGSCALVGLATLIRNRDHNGHVFRSPLHWLVLAPAVSAVIYSLVQNRYVFEIMNGGMGPSSVYQLAISIPPIIICGLHIFSAVNNRGAWRILFAVSAGVAAAESFFQWMTLLNFWWSIRYFFTASFLVGSLTSLIMVILGIQQYVSSNSKDWVQLVGIGVILYALFAMTIGNFLIPMLLSL